MREEPSSGSKLRSMFSVFKKGSATKTPSSMFGSPQKRDVSNGKRLFSFSPAKQTHSPSKLHQTSSQYHIESQNQQDLIPAHTQSMNTDPTSISTDPSAIKVVVRIRPRNERESNMGGAICVQQTGSSIKLGPPAEQHHFTFDHVAQETATQEDVFEVAGKPIVDNCLRGYNACLLAYGQTGSGKTHTMLGPTTSDGSSCPSDHPHRGLIQRVFEHLFASTDPSNTTIVCSFLEIYNETISDLLVEEGASSGSVAIREDARRGVFVEGICEERVLSVDHVASLLQRGIANRRVGETLMNERSSRSHSIFTATISQKVKKTDSNTTTALLTSRLHLVDLAGSERQKHSGAAGERLREASSINKSLSTLGLVIMSLVDQQAGRQRHVPYRDSKLTFLLQDSLGGNAKAVLIAAVSPAAVNAAETLSTLRFADGAKRIKNKAVVNEDDDGDVDALRTEIKRLKGELSLMMQQQQPGVLMPTIAECSSSGGSGGDETAARRALVGALRREENSIQQISHLQAELEEIRGLVAAKDAELQRTQMMLKLKESRLARLGQKSGEQTDDTVVALQQEIDSLKAKLESHPEVKRFAVENLHLSHEVTTLQKMVDTNEMDSLRDDIALLRQEMLTMSVALKKAEEEREHAVAEADASRVAKERAEGKLIELQRALNKHAAEPATEQRIDELMKENDSLRLVVAEVEALRVESSKMCGHAAELESECENLKRDLAIKTNDAEELDVAYKGTLEKLSAAWEDIERLEKDLHEAGTRYNHLETSYNEAVIEIDELSSALADMTQSRDDFAREAVVLKETVEELQCRNTALQSDLEEEQLRAETAEKTSAERMIALESTREILSNKEEELKEERTRCATLENSLNDTTSKYETSKKKVSLLNGEVTALTKDLIDASTSLKETKDHLDAVQHALSRTEKSYTDLQAEYQELENSKDELAYELSDKSASLTELKERLTNTQAALVAVKDAKGALERQKAQLTAELENAVRLGTVAERERASLSKRVSQLEDALDEANTKARAVGEGPLESQQQLLLARAEAKENAERLEKLKADAAKMSAIVQEKEEEISRVRAAMAAEVSDAAQQVQELLAAQARAEAAERRAAELANQLHVPRRLST